MGTKVHLVHRTVHLVCLVSAVPLDRVWGKAEAIKVGGVRLPRALPTIPNSMGFTLLKVRQAGQSIPGSGHCSVYNNRALSVVEVSFCFVLIVVKYMST